MARLFTVPWLAEHRVDLGRNDVANEFYDLAVKRLFQVFLAAMLIVLNRTLIIVLDSSQQRYSKALSRVLRRESGAAKNRMTLVSRSIPNKAKRITLRKKDVID